MKISAITVALVVLAVAPTAVPASPLKSPTITSSELVLVHRGGRGGWHCNRERWSQRLGWHYHSRRCRMWRPHVRSWRGEPWRRGCWVSRRGGLTCRF